VVRAAASAKPPAISDKSGAAPARGFSGEELVIVRTGAKQVSCQAKCGEQRFGPEIAGNLCGNASSLRWPPERLLA
jgi:hypothetical protein